MPQPHDVCFDPWYETEHKFHSDYLTEMFPR